MSCGSPLPSPQAAPPQPPAQPARARRRRWPWVVGIGGLALAVGLGGGAWFLLNRPGTTTGEAFEPFGIIPDQPDKPTERWSLRASDIVEDCQQSPQTSGASARCALDVRWVGTDLLQVETTSWAADNSDTQRTLFVDPQTGETRWGGDEYYAQCNTLDDKTLDDDRVLCFTETEAVAFDPQNGQELWRTEVGEVDSLWLVRQTDTALYLVPYSSDGGTTTLPVTKLSQDGEKEWTTQVRGRPAGPTLPIISDDLLGLPLREGDRWQAIDLDDGTAREAAVLTESDWRGTLTWTEDGRRQFAGVDLDEQELAWPMAADTQDGLPLAFTSRRDDEVTDTTLSVRDPDNAEQELWSRPNATTLAYCSDVLVLHQQVGDATTDSEYVAVDPATGEELWTAEGEANSWPAAWCDSERLITSQNGELVAFDLTSGQVQWRLEATAGVIGRGNTLITKQTEGGSVIQGWG